MKIGYFTSAFPYRNPINNKMTGKYVGGGVENVAYNFAVQMAKRGHEVYVFTSSIDSRKSVENYGNITIHRYKRSFTIGSAPISIDILYKPLKVGLNLDVVHAHAGNPPAPIAAYRYAKKKKKPFVVTYHGDTQEKWGGIGKRMGVVFYNKYLLDKILSYADVVISPSGNFINETGFLGKHKDKIIVIPNGINIGEFDIVLTKDECRKKLGFALNEEIILFVGALNPHKGPDVLLKAIPKILENRSGVKLVFVGRGEMREELERMCKRLDVEKCVNFAGFVGDNFKKALYYKSADVFVLPSYTEMFPLVLLEASASGLPLVVSNLNTFKCIIREGYNGLFTEMGNKSNLADAIIYLLKNEDLRRKMGDRGREIVKDYSWTRVVEETERVYLSLVG